jgi:competence protein ComEA
MMKNMKRFVLLMAPLALAASMQAQGLPDGEGRATFESVCGSCHGADLVIGSQRTKTGWEETVEAMKNRGASGSEEDFKVVMTYLSRYFGMPVEINKATAKDLETEFGVTAAEAEAIVKHRTAQGNFKAWEDLGKVQGVSVAKLEPLKSRIKF